MRVVVQRAINASCVVNGEITGKIDKGFMILVGFTNGDSETDIKLLAKKVVGLRVFEDEAGKMNLGLKDVSGEILAISQFTLYADCKKGNRPSFVNAGKPELANSLYEYIIEKCKEQVPNVQTGSFGADMKIALVNDGPFTIVLDSRDL